MIKICKKCKKEFNTQVKIDNRFYSSTTRSYCFECSPVGANNSYCLSKNDNTYKTCKSCGDKLKRSEFYTSGTRTRNGKTSLCFSVRCIKCTRLYIENRNRLIKQDLVDYKGGQCEKCGYNKCLSALEFHHKDPSQKDFEITSKRGCSIDTVKKEVDKCLLVCSNCHKEIHESIKKS